MNINVSSLSSQISSAIFSKLDTNNQGYIDKSQLASALGNSDSSTDSSSTDATFTALDTDNDGKITKSEMTKGIENLLIKLDSSSSTQAKGGMPPPPPGGMPPPPPPNDSDSSSSDSSTSDSTSTTSSTSTSKTDTGLSKDQMTEMASSTKDAKLSSLLTDVSNNFDAADTNKDGKVTRDEAMAYEESKKSSSNASKSTTSSSSSNEVAMKKIAELVAAYGLNSSDNSSSLSYSA